MKNLIKIISVLFFILFAFCDLSKAQNIRIDQVKHLQDSLNAKVNKTQLNSYPTTKDVEEIVGDSLYKHFGTILDFDDLAIIKELVPLIQNYTTIYYYNGQWVVGLLPGGSGGSGDWKVDNITIEATFDSTLQIKQSYSDSIGNYRFAPKISPTFTGTVRLPASIYINSVQMTSTATQLNYLTNSTGTTGTTLSNLVFSASPTFTGTVTLPSTTSIGNVSSTELGYLDNVTSNIQTQLNAKLGSSDYSALTNLINQRLYQNFAANYPYVDDPTGDAYIPIIVGIINASTELSKLPISDLTQDSLDAVNSRVTSIGNRLGTVNKTAYQFVEPDVEDTVLVFWLDDAIVIDSIAYVVADSLRFQVNLTEEGSTLFSTPPTLYGEGTITTFGNATLLFNEKAYIYFSHIGGDVLSFVLKFYWRYL